MTEKLNNNNNTPKKETMETYSNQKTKQKKKVKCHFRPHLSIISPNVNGLNPPIKRHKVAESTKKQKSNIHYLQRIHLKSKDKQAQ